MVRVRTPIAEVRKAILDFRQSVPLDATVAVVRQEGMSRDVYIRVPTIIPDYWVWTLIRFDPPEEGDGRFVYRGHQIDGNLDELQIAWKLVADGDETLARFELLAVPTLPLPRKWIYRDTKRGVVDVIAKFRASLAPPSIEPSRFPCCE